MRVGESHLTYCTNVHPGETLPEVIHNLTHEVAQVKARVSPAAPFAVGLWLSHRAALALDDEASFAQLRETLATRGLYVPTLNGFPFGAFHGTRVKENVYVPDWRDPQRREHSHRLARVLANLLPEGVRGSVSTLPGGYKPLLTASDDHARVAEQLIIHAAELHAIEQATGKHIMLGLEPEPCCMLETIAETVAFFDRHLQSERAVAQLANHVGVTYAAAQHLLARHLGVCLDACHAAVEMEDPQQAVSALRRAEIPIAKVQLSAGLRVPAVDDAARAALQAFAEDVYLHQVVQRRGEEITRFTDLPEALASLQPGELGEPGHRTSPPEWRVHFHVPVFAQMLGLFESTQSFLVALLHEHAKAPLSDHLEVETYTWGVLPEELRARSLPDAIALELAFVLETLRMERG